MLVSETSLAYRKQHVTRRRALVSTFCHAELVGALGGSQQYSYWR